MSFFIFMLILLIAWFFWSLNFSNKQKSFINNFKDKHNIVEQFENVKYIGGHPLVSISNTVRGNLYIMEKAITYVDTIKTEELFSISLKDITKCSLETKESITATRMLLTGILAFALKKRKEYIRIQFKNKLNDFDNIIFSYSGNSADIIAKINKQRLKNQEQVEKIEEENKTINKIRKKPAKDDDYYKTENVNKRIDDFIENL
ncbi:MAG: hypothetical protein ACOCRO_09150 [Halanaerobiales bacterium]